MAWAKFDDNCPEHPKIAGLDDKTFRLWFSLILYSARFGLNGCIPCADFMRLSRRLRARLVHRERLFGADLVHDRGAFVEIHDYADYQPTSRTTAETSQKRSDAGKKGAEARWQKDGKLPLAKNAPDPTRPDPTRPHHTGGAVRQELSTINDNDSLTLEEVAGFGFGEYGQTVGGPAAADLRRLDPIKVWELRAVFQSWPRNWGGFTKLLREMRNGGDAPPAKDKKPEEPSYKGRFIPQGKRPGHD